MLLARIVLSVIQGARTTVMATRMAHLYKCGLNAHLLPEASLACQEPPSLAPVGLGLSEPLLALPESGLACQEPHGVAPDRQGKLLLDWTFASLASLPLYPLWPMLAWL